MRTRTTAQTAAVGGLLLTVAAADAAAAVVLARGKSFLNVDGVRAIALGVASVVALAGGVTMWRAHVPPRPGRRASHRLLRASLVFDALVCLSLPGIVTHFGTGRFCSIGGVGWLAMLAPFALLLALGLLAGAVARADHLAAAGVGVLLAAAPIMFFLLARLADRITCGD